MRGQKLLVSLGIFSGCADTGGGHAVSNEAVDFGELLYSGIKG
jgi:hypothetical protein